MVKFPLFLRFLDDFIQKIRKYNDLEKVSIDLKGSVEESKLSSSGAETQKLLKVQFNRSLQAVLKIFYRLTLNMESDTEYFSLEFYQNLVFEN